MGSGGLSALLAAAGRISLCASLRPVSLTKLAFSIKKISYYACVYGSVESCECHWQCHSKFQNVCAAVAKLQLPQQSLADLFLAGAAEGDSWIVHVPKYAARTILTALKTTSAGVSKPLQFFA